MNETDKLVGLFKSQEDFIQFFIQNCYFIDPQSVKERAEEMLNKIENGETLPKIWQKNQQFL